MGTLANSEDPDEIFQNVAFGQHVKSLTLYIRERNP